MGHLPIKIMQSDDSWLEQQLNIRAQNILGFFADIQLITRFPEYRSEYFNLELLYREMEYQYQCFLEIREEIRRREIP